MNYITGFLGIESNQIKVLRERLDQAAGIGKMISTVGLIASFAVIFFAVLLSFPFTSTVLGLVGGAFCILSLDGIAASSKAKELASKAENFKEAYHLDFQKNTEQNRVFIKKLINQILEPTYVLKGLTTCFIMSRLT